MTRSNNILKYLGNLVKTDTFTINHANFVYPITLHRRCGIVMMTFNDLQGLTNGAHTLFTLPAGWRPVQDVYFLITEPASTASDIRVTIRTAGVVSVYYYGSYTGVLNIADTLTWITEQ